MSEPTTHQDAGLCEFIASSPRGAGMREISRFMRKSRHACEKNLDRLLEAGLIARVPTASDGRYANFCAPEHAAAIVTARAAQIAAAQRAMLDKRNERMRRVRAEAAAVRPPKVRAPKTAQHIRALEIARAVAAFERPIVQRIVPAHLAAPLRPRGPASVFQLGAFA